MLCLLEDPPKVLSLKILDIVAVAVAVAVSVVWAHFACVCE